MKKVLYITANPKKESESFSLDTGRKFIERYKKENPNHEVVELNLYDLDIPFIDEDVFSGWGKLREGLTMEQLTKLEREKVIAISRYTDQFIEADKYVFVTPMWNLSLPPKVKVYIDTVMVAGKTFRYTAQGPEGMLKDKKAVHIHASGGIYSREEVKHMEFGDSYLKSVLKFMGIEDTKTILLEGTNVGSTNKVEMKRNAEIEIEEVIEEF